MSILTCSYLGKDLHAYLTLDRFFNQFSFSKTLTGTCTKVTLQIGTNAHIQICMCCTTTADYSFEKKIRKQWSITFSTHTLRSKRSYGHGSSFRLFAKIRNLQSFLHFKVLVMHHLSQNHVKSLTFSYKECEPLNKTSKYSATDQIPIYLLITLGVLLKSKMKGWSQDFTLQSLGCCSHWNIASQFFTMKHLPVPSLPYFWLLF